MFGRVAIRLGIGPHSSVCFIFPTLFIFITYSIEGIQALAHISRSVLYTFAVYKAISLHTCVVMATKPVHRLQIRPEVHN